MGKEVVFDYSRAAGFVSAEEDGKNRKPQRCVQEMC